MIFTLLRGINKITLLRGRFNSLSQTNLVHKLILGNQAMKILDAKAAFDRKWEELEQFPASSVTKLKNKKEVIENANKKRKGEDNPLCNADGFTSPQELEQTFKTCRGCVVIRGDLVQYDSGSCAAFTEQGSSASQMTSATSFGGNCHTTWMRQTSKRRSISLHPSHNGGRSDADETSQVRLSGYMDADTATQVAQNVAKHSRTCGSA